MSKRSWTWERLRDFFAGVGTISLPTSEELERDVRAAWLHLPAAMPMPPFDEVLPKVSYREIPWDAPDTRFDGMEWKEIPDYPSAVTLGDALRMQEERLRKRFWEEMPKDFGVDLARGKSETWLMRYDWETGKMIYRKIDPADMVRRDDGEEGIPNGEH